MSTKINISDVCALVELAMATVSEARNAAGEQHDLTEDTESAFMTLDHLKSKMLDPKSVINKAKGGRRNDLGTYVRGCRRHLRRIKSTLVEFSDTHKGISQPRDSIQFEDSVMKKISRSRTKVSTYISAITLTLQLLSLGHQGSVEKELSRQRGEGKTLRASINLILAKRTVLARRGRETANGPVRSESREGNDFWHSIQQELMKKGFESKIVNGNKNLIKAYMKELEQRGVLSEKVFKAQPKRNSFEDTEQAGSDSSRSNSSHDGSTLEDFDSLSIDEDQKSEKQQDARSYEDMDLNPRQNAFQRNVKRKDSFPVDNERIILDTSSVPTRASVTEIEAMERQQTPRRSKRSRTPSPAPPSKSRSPLSLLLFPMKQKSQRAHHTTRPPLESPKRQKRLPPPPRPSSPTPDPPAWWLEERQRRRPPGYERGRSPPPPPPPPPQYFVSSVYSRTISAYPETSFNWETVY